MRFILLPLTAAFFTGTSSREVTDVPLYCRLLQVGLVDTEFQPLVEDLKLSTVFRHPLLGKFDVTATRVEVGAVRVTHCTASADDQGRFTLGIGELGLELRRVDWQFVQRMWPRLVDGGRAIANATVSFDVLVDMEHDVRDLFALNISQIDVSLRPQNKTWIANSMEKWAGFRRPLVSATFERLAKKALDNSLAIIRKQGGCAFLEHALEWLDMVKFGFISYEPFPTHVPLLGDVNISVNSTSITPPIWMDCQHVAFNGTTLTARIEGAAFSASFTWAYQKVGYPLWLNQGSALANIMAGTELHIDLMKPKETQIHIDVPTLNLRLHADADNWMYQALDAVMVPLVREALQLFSGRVLSRQIAKCLADPSCPNLHAGPLIPTSYIGTTSAIGTVASTRTSSTTTVDETLIIV